jgi:hypothetical protein
MKIANDVRWLASGPRSGIGELQFPENEPGSSIMPGKVNPTQCEALTMLCCQVMGNDVAINMGGASGNFRAQCVPPHGGAQLPAKRAPAGRWHASFNDHCAVGIEPHRARIAELVARSLMLVTALNPHIGYDKAAAIAKKAHQEGTSLREAAIATGWVVVQGHQLGEQRLQRAFGSPGLPAIDDLLAMQFAHRAQCLHQCGTVITQVGVVAQQEGQPFAGAGLDLNARAGAQVADQRHWHRQAADAAALGLHVHRAAGVQPFHLLGQQGFKGRLRGLGYARQRAQH